jgi:hypothetical protein
VPITDDLNVLPAREKTTYSGKLCAETAGFGASRDTADAEGALPWNALTRPPRAATLSLKGPEGRGRGCSAVPGLAL